MKKFVFLFLLIGLFLMAYAPEGNNEVKKNKMLEEMERVMNLFDSNQNWLPAEASYYDPMDPKQTKEKPDGIGAFGRRIVSGSVAMGSPQAKLFRKKKSVVFIKVKDLDVHTPYGKGIFRVDDLKNDRYQDKDGKYYIDFFEKDLNAYYLKQGRFKVSFRYHKIIEKGSSS